MLVMGAQAVVAWRIAGTMSWIPVRLVMTAIRIKAIVVRIYVNLPFAAMGIGVWIGKKGKRVMRGAMMETPVMMTGAPRRVR